MVARGARPGGALNAVDAVPARPSALRLRERPARARGRGECLAGFPPERDALALWSPQAARADRRSLHAAAARTAARTARPRLDALALAPARRRAGRAAASAPGVRLERTVALAGGPGGNRPGRSSRGRHRRKER